MTKPYNSKNHVASDVTVGNSYHPLVIVRQELSRWDKRMNEQKANEIKGEED